MKNLFAAMGKEQKMLLASVAAGALAAVLVFALVHEMRLKMEKKMDPVEVVGAAVYIPAFADITADKVKIMKIPSGMVTGAHIPAADLKKIMHKRTVVPFVADETLMKNKIADSGSELNTIIPDSMRAISIGVDKEKSVSYNIKPGDYVDILLTYEISDLKSTHSTTATILQAVQVIAIGKNTSMQGQGSPDEYDAVTLALTPRDAEILTISLEKGRVNFVLRPVGDTTAVGVQPVTLNDVLSGGKSVPAAQQAAPAATQPPAQPGDDEDSGRKTIQ